MIEPVVDHQKRFQAAVDVIQKLPKNGSYRPSYKVMLRFYSLYKQAVCGPCAVPRPGFWDPVGRYKWDAWSQLGKMSSESAMAAYVDEMKKVAQEVIDTMPIDENTASLFKYFEPLYLFIDDMPRPPESLLKLREAESAVLEVMPLTSDSESEIFSDSVDSLELHPGFVANPVVQEDPAAAFCAVTMGAPQGSLGRSPGDGSGHGGGGGHGSEGGAEMLHEAHLQQQIILALQRLREDMRSVMDRLEVLERLAATHAHNSDLRSHLQCSPQQEQMSWPFDMSGQTVVFLLLWPFVAHCLVYL
ncbi:acyl-CoA-binding domain-containing protein 4, partial [Neolamprologus brichardi]|uniref:acyl-CoA-binding domain-containing protein 4 n=1 Tax=Neolamprologus brichardi TaxID=32507 RepID=UPI0003EC2C95